MDKAIEAGRECSTPLGVTVFGTRLAVGLTAGWMTCSTPLGVTVFGTSPNPPTLTCSSELCSTPLGVTVFGTDSRRVTAVDG